MSIDQELESLIADLRGATAEAGDPSLAGWLAQGHDQDPERTLRVLILGAPGSGRFALTNLFLRRPGLLPTSALPRRPVAVRLCHGPALSVGAIGADEAETAVDPGDLERIFAYRGGIDPAPRRVEIRLPDPLLAHCDVLIESISAQHPPAEWWAILQRADAIVFVCDASALLSAGEREFFRDVISPLVSPARIVVVLNRVDLIPVEERPDLVESAQAFFSGERPPWRIMLYAPRLQAALLAQNPDAADPLRDFIEGQVLARSASLRTLARYEQADAALRVAERALAGRKALVALDSARLAALQQQIAGEERALNSRLQDAQRRLRLVAESLLSEEFARAVDTYGQGVRAAYQRHLEANRPVDVAADLRDFLDRQWGAFLAGGAGGIAALAQQEIERTYRLLDAEISGAAAEETAASRLIEQLAPAEADVPFLIGTPGQAFSWNRLTAGLKIGGWLLIVTQNIFVGLALLGASELLSIAEQRRIAGEQLAQSAAAERVIAAYEEALKQRGAEALAGLADQVYTILRERSQQRLIALRAQLDALDAPAQAEPPTAQEATLAALRDRLRAIRPTF